jgi:hypothetical protein
MTVYFKVTNLTELYNKVGDIVGDLPRAWSKTVLPNYPHYRTTAHYTFKNGLRSIKVHLIKDINQDIYDEPNTEIYEIIITKL